MALTAVEYDARTRTQHISSRRERLGCDVARVARGGDARRSRRRLSCGSGRDPVSRARGDAGMANLFVDTTTGDDRRASPEKSVTLSVSDDVFMGGRTLS